MGSMIAALIAAVSVFVIMLETEKNVLQQYEKGNILIAGKEIPQGQIITSENAQLYFETLELDRNCIPQTAITAMEDVVDMVSATKIEQGVLLTRGMFETRDEITANMKTPVIAGFKAEDLYQVVGGVLRTGDRINIYRVGDDGETGLIWKNVFVQQVFDNVGNPIGSEDGISAAQRINIYMEQDNVEQFYSNLGAGTLRVVKVCE